MASISPIASAIAMLALICVGLTVNALTLGLPFVVWKLLFPTTYSGLAIIGLLELFHVWCLWKIPSYLACCRCLTLPIRQVFMPAVALVIQSDGVKDKEDTPYLIVPSERRASDENSSQNLLMSFRGSVRRRHKQMYQKFQAAGMRIESIQSETSLNPSLVLPVMWEHERRQCELDGNNAAEEFLKRFLVMTVVPNGVLDLFYQDETLLAVQFSFRQGYVYHWSSYFSRSDGRQSGIWFTGIFTALVRAVHIPGITHVNAHVHLQDSKKNAGFQIASFEDDELLDKLHPRTHVTRIPNEFLRIER